MQEFTKAYIKALLKIKGVLYMFRLSHSQLILLKSNFRAGDFNFIANGLHLVLAGKLLTINDNHYLNLVMRYIGFNDKPYSDETAPKFIITKYPSKKFLNKKVWLELFIHIIPSYDDNKTLYEVLKVSVKHY